MVQKKEYYCGAKKPPTGKRKGTQKECAASRQLRLYGLLSIKSNSGVYFPTVTDTLKRKTSPEKLSLTTEGRPKRQRRTTSRYGF